MYEKRIARRLLADGKTLSKKKIPWNTPADLIRPSRDMKATLIGIGTWKNIDENYVVIATNGKLMMLSKETLETINKTFKRGSV